MVNKKMKNSFWSEFVRELVSGFVVAAITAWLVVDEGGKYLDALFKKEPVIMFFVSVFAMYLFHTRKHIFTVISENGIKKIATDSLKEAIKEKDVFITGVHRGGDASGAALIADANLSSSDDGKLHPDGLLVLRSFANVEEYSDHCLKLLDKVIKKGKSPTIYSMSDMGLDKTFWYYSGHESAIEKGADHVKKWLDKVKEYYDDGLIQIKRIQVLTDGRFEFMQKFVACYENNKQGLQIEEKEVAELLEYVRPSIKNLFKDDNKSLIDALSKGYEYYCATYVLRDDGAASSISSGVWGVYLRECMEDFPNAPSILKQVVPGEFVLVDGEVLVRYQEDSCLLETLIGGIITPFENGFQGEAWEKVQSLSPLFFGKGNYNASCSTGEFKA